MPEIPPPNAKSPNGALALLSTLAQSTNKWVQLGTLALIAFSGIGNWLATWNSSNANRTEIEVNRRENSQGQERLRAEVARQVEEIHSWIRSSTEEFHKGNEDSAANRKLLNQLVKEDLDAFERRQNTSLNNQNQMMKNQSQMLENDSVLIRETHDLVEKIEKWKKAEQMRGAPP
jgi:hypothetical protein